MVGEGRPSTTFSYCMCYFVYIMTNKPNGTLYIGVTDDIVRRAWEHREGLTKGFTKKYGLKRLVYFEEFAYIDDAIAREKLLKTWLRAWKVRLIKGVNPDWRDLAEGFVDRVG